jgi:RNA polymerase sigma-B factor
MTVLPDAPSTTTAVAPAEAPSASAVTPPAVREDRTTLTNRLLAEAAAATDPVERKRLHDEVVVLNAGVANAIASRYRGRGVATDDLTQIAFLGMWKAIQRFDPSFERDFLSYAVPTIKGEIKRHFRDNGWSVRPPRRIQELQGRMSAALEQLTQDLSRTPRPGEVAQFLEVPLEDVVEALSADGCFTPTSLDTPVGAEDAGTLGELLGSEEEHLSAAEARVMLAPAVRSLGERDRRILYLRFFKQWTQEQIATDIGVTQMQVSRLLARILRDLRGQLG